MAEIIRDQTEMSADEEREWPGGSGTLYSTVDCALKIRNPNQQIDLDADTPVDPRVETGIRVTPDSPWANFTLGSGLVLSLSADGYIHPIKGMDIRGHL